MKPANFSCLAALALLCSCGGNGNEDVEPLDGDDEIDVADQTRETGKTNDTLAPDQPSDEQSEFDRRMAYFFSEGDRGPSLSFGVPRTDNIALSLRCPPGAMGETILVSFTRPADVVSERPRSVTFVSGDAEQPREIETRETQLGTTVEATISPDSDVMQTYRRGEALTVSYGDETIVIPSRESDSEIGQFFAACAP